MSDLVLDKYQVIRRLAVGGMGEIYLAQQRGESGFQRHVILKRLLPQFAADEAFVRQFLDEARLAATLNHPNIMSIYEVGRSSGTYYIAMEYVHGIDLGRLFERLAARGEAMPFAVAARIVHDAALGLHHAHTATDPSGRPLLLVHRDISPSNLMVRRDGVTKLVDFGIAKAQHRLTRTESGLVKGKVSYLSPEQARGGELDARSDQFSLGVVLWELCANRRLFFGENPVEVFKQIAAAAIPPPSTYAPELPEILVDVAVRMVAQSADDRFADCREVATALGDFLLGQSSPTDTREVEAFVGLVAGEEIARRTATDRVEPGPDFVLDLGAIHQLDPGEAAAAASDAAPPTVPLRVRARSSETTFSSAPTQPSPTLPLPPSQPAVEPSSPAATWRGRRALITVAALAVVTAAVVGVALGSGRSEDDPAPSPATPVESAVAEAAAPALAPTAVAPAAELVGAQGSPPDAARADKRTAPGHRGKRRSARPSGRSRPPAVDSSPEPGTLSLSTTPWTKVTIDGKPYGATPLYRVELAPGAHRLKMENADEDISIVRRIRIQSEQSLKLKCDVTVNRLRGDCARRTGVW